MLTLSRIKFTMAQMSKTAIKRVRLGRTGTSLKIGLLGMANIGKSSTFNLLSNLNVPAENVPFCTIDPNTAFISVKDNKFQQLCTLFSPQKEVGPILRIVDIAGLVKGASEGFGLGNEFLSHITQVDALYHVVRAFKNEKVSHTEGGMDPVRDIKIIRHELIQKDLQMAEKRSEQYSKKAKKTKDKDINLHNDVLNRVVKTLKSGIQIRNLDWKKDEIQALNKYLFLTSKPMIYLINMSQKDYLEDNLLNQDQIFNVISENGKYESKFIKYSVQHQQNRQPKQKSQIQTILHAGYDELQIQHFYTVGKDEVKAWAFRKGENAAEAAGKIHTDFTKHFINAEIMHSQMLLKHPEYKDRLQKYSKKEGRNYMVKNGDIMHINCKIK